MGTSDLDLSNRLYGPEAFWPGARPTWTGKEAPSSEANGLPAGNQTTELTLDARTPSVAEPGMKAKVDERLKQLGY